MFVRLLAAAALAGVLAAGSVVPTATAATPCWKGVVDAWFAGRLTASYAPSCYRDALSHLPEDARAYTTASGDIQRALLASIRARARTVAPVARRPAAAPKAGRRLEGPAAPKRQVRATIRPRPVQSGIPPAPAESLFERAAGAASSGGAGSVPLPIVVLATISGAMVAAAAIGRAFHARS
jgi:hypothetical protein